MWAISKSLRRSSGRQSQQTNDIINEEENTSSSKYKQINSRNNAPDWLKDEEDGNDNTNTNNIDDKRSPSWLKSQEEGDESSENQPLDDQQSTINNANIIEEDGRRRRRCYYSIRTILCTVSLILFALFVYSTIVQYDDPDRIQWYIYYGLQAVVPVVFLVHYNIFCCGQRCFGALHNLLERCVYIVCGVLAVWSMVYVGLISRDLKKHTTRQQSQEEDDPTYGEIREELIFELLGVLLGLFSAIYHAIVTCCLARKRRYDDNDDGS